MTFADRARAAAKRRFPALHDIFVAGASWAVEQEPSEAEIHDAAVAICESR